jgi:hypothetical protein
MFKYAEIYGGKIRDIKESHLGFVEFCSIWDPTCFWYDVTGIDDIGIGYIVKSDTVRGVYFEAPPIEDESSFEFKKAAKLEQLIKAFESIQETATVISSLGFIANAGIRANRDVNGLIKQMKADKTNTTEFRDYNDIFQVVTLAELELLEIEIIKNGHYIYKQKWDMERALYTATTVEDIDAIDIHFEMLDLFTTQYEE